MVIVIEQIVMKVWLSRDVQRDIEAECSRYDDLETGGVLLGYWNDTFDVPVIAEVVGPGPQAVHRSRSFVPDSEFHELEIDRHYRASNGVLTYLGDWHSHPKGNADLSKKDIATLARIAAFPSARVPRPLMLVAVGPPWDISVWLGIRPIGWHWPRRLATLMLPVELF